jgi:aspartate/methionine/tyrosine aminotransferase
VYPEADLRAVNELCREKGIYHVSDEAYEYFTWDGVAHCSPAGFPESQSHTISLYSLSKAYGFASWRIGYMLIPEQLFESIQKIQDTQLICPAVVSQVAAVAALEAGRDYCRQHVPAIQAARIRFLEALNNIRDRCSIPEAKGAFYFLLRLHRQQDDVQLIHRLIKEFGVAAIPGSAFGARDGCYLRVAYGAITGPAAGEGIDRLVKGLQQLA